MLNFKQIEKFLKKSELVTWSLSVVLLTIANYLIFIYVPNERVMGAVQRIFYFHVASAFACYLAFAIVLISSILYLVRKNKVYDALNVSAAEVGFLFCTIVLISGMIWGKAAWGTWFRMEPRLVTFLLLWLIFLAFNILRVFGEPRLVANHSAILGIVGAITVPLMVYSIKLLPAFKQLHPQVIEKAGLPTSMMLALLVTSLGVIVFQFFLISLRFRMELLRR